jgi:MFS family permease
VLFRNRNFRIWAAAILIASVGFWTRLAAQTWLVLSLTSSELELGGVLACQYVPVLALSLVAGVIVDRLPRRLILLTTSGATAAQSVALMLLTAGDAVRLWHVYLLAFGLGVVIAFSQPAGQVMLAELVGKEDLPNAIAFNSTTFNIGRLLGPALAGALLATTGPAVCFGLTAVAYLVQIGGLLLIRIAPTPSTGQVREAGLGDLRQGLRYVGATPAVLVTIVLLGLLVTFSAGFNTWVPLLIKHTMGLGPRDYGWLMAALGAGALAAGIILACVDQTPSRNWLLAAAGALGVLELILGTVFSVMRPPMGAAVPLLAGIGFTSSAAIVTATSLVQTHTPDALRGRVMSVQSMVVHGSVPACSLIAGVIAGAFGAPAAPALGGAVALMSVGCILARNRGRGRQPEPAPAV